MSIQNPYSEIPKLYESYLSTGDEDLFLRRLYALPIKFHRAVIALIDHVTSEPISPHDLGKICSLAEELHANFFHELAAKLCKHVLKIHGKDEHGKEEHFPLRGKIDKLYVESLLASGYFSLASQASKSATASRRNLAFYEEGYEEALENKMVAPALIDLAIGNLNWSLIVAEELILIFKGEDSYILNSLWLLRAELLKRNRKYEAALRTAEHARAVLMGACRKERREEEKKNLGHDERRRNEMKRARHELGSFRALADIYCAMGNPRAIGIYTCKVLPFVQRTFDADYSGEMMVSLWGLGNAISELDRDGADLVHLQDALEIAKDIYGAGSLHAATSHRHLGLAYMKRGDRERCFAHLASSDEIETKVHGEVHRYKVLNLVALARAKAHFGEINESVNLYDKARETHARLDFVDEVLMKQIKRERSLAALHASEEAGDDSSAEEHSSESSDSDSDEWGAGTGSRRVMIHS